jgi:hypothetical protein
VQLVFGSLEEGGAVGLNVRCGGYQPAWCSSRLVDFIIIGSRHVTDVARGLRGIIYCRTTDPTYMEVQFEALDFLGHAIEKIFRIFVNFIDFTLMLLVGFPRIHAIDNGLIM